MIISQIQVLCHTMGGGVGRVNNFPGKCVTEVYGSMLLALRGRVLVSIFLEKSAT